MFLWHLFVCFYLLSFITTCCCLHFRNDHTFTLQMPAQTPQNFPSPLVDQIKGGAIYIPMFLTSFQAYSTYLDTTTWDLTKEQLKIMKDSYGWFSTWGKIIDAAPAKNQDLKFEHISKIYELLVDWLLKCGTRDFIGSDKKIKNQLKLDLHRLVLIKIRFLASEQFPKEIVAYVNEKFKKSDANKLIDEYVTAMLNPEDKLKWIGASHEGDDLLPFLYQCIKLAGAFLKSFKDNKRINWEEPAGAQATYNSQNNSLTITQRPIFYRIDGIASLTHEWSHYINSKKDGIKTSYDVSKENKDIPHDQCLNEFMAYYLDWWITEPLWSQGDLIRRSGSFIKAKVCKDGWEIPDKPPVWGIWDPEFIKNPSNPE